MAFEPPDLSVGKLIAATCGALVSLRFVTGTIPERICMAGGGAAFSYYASTPAAIWLGMSNAEGLVGFLIGLFGMAVMAKIYEVIQLTDATKIASDAVEAIKRKWGA
jgi:hypothetical protein